MLVVGESSEAVLRQELDIPSVFHPWSGPRTPFSPFVSVHPAFPQDFLSVNSGQLTVKHYLERSKEVHSNDAAVPVRDKCRSEKPF